MAALMKTIPFQDKSKGIAWAYLGMGKGFWRNFWVGWVQLMGKIVTKYGLVEPRINRKGKAGGCFLVQL